MSDRANEPRSIVGWVSPLFFDCSDAVAKGETGINLTIYVAPIMVGGKPIDIPVRVTEITTPLPQMTSWFQNCKEQ